MQQEGSVYLSPILLRSCEQGVCILLSVAGKSAGDTQGTAGMVKYRQAAAKMPVSHAAEDVEPTDMQLHAQ